MSDVNYMENKNKPPIRIISYNDPPLANDCFDTYPSNETCFNPGPGYEIEYIYTVINGMLMYNVQWIKAANLNEVIASVDNGTADVAGTSILVEPQYVRKWGFPPPAFQYDSVVLLVRERYVNQSQVFILLRSFTWDLWLIMMAASLVFIAIRKVSKNFRAKTDYARTVATKTFRRVLYALRANVFYAVWFFVVSLLLNFYSNLIAVDLVAPDRIKTVPFKTLPELGEKLLTRECRFILLEKYATYKELNEYLINPVTDGYAQKPWAPIFVRAFRINPPRIVADRTEMVNSVLNDTCSVGLDWTTMGTYYNTRYCDIRIVSFPEELPMFGYTFYTSNEILKPLMAAIMVSSPLIGYTTYLNEKYFSKRVPVECSSGAVVSVNAVTLKKMQDCFVILGTGLSVAFCVISYQQVKRCYRTRSVNFA